MKITIKTYGRTELAQQHFPHIDPHSAWRKMHRWMMIKPRLRRLTEGTSRTFTPREVQLIFDELGEP